MYLCLFLSIVLPVLLCSFFFFFNDTATTEIYTLSLHDALPICAVPDRLRILRGHEGDDPADANRDRRVADRDEDRKSTRLNSSHANISYAVFCLKKKKLMIDLRVGRKPDGATLIVVRAVLLLGT